MPVATSYTRHYPFLLESDLLSLSSGFAVGESALYDIPLKAIHHLRSPGEEVAFALLGGIRLKALRELAVKLGISEHQLNELLGFLNAIGALRCRRNLRERMLALYIQMKHLVFGSRYKPISWRHPATPGLVLLGIVRATWPVTLATAGVCALASAAQLMRPQHIWSFGTFGLLLFICSLFIHEMAHIAVLKRHRVKPHILQAGLRLGVIHRKLPPGAEALSSLLGPVAGSTFCFTVAFWVMATGRDMAGLLGAIIGLFHALSLLPWYGDGASFHKAVRERRGEHETYA